VAGGNAGRHVDNTYVVVPELGAHASLELLPGVKVRAAYNFLYINSVMRPGEQVDLVVNARLVPLSQAFGSLTGPAAPTFPFRKTDFYAHGVQFGIELTY
jgi:hypothetical protein